MTAFWRLRLLPASFRGARFNVEQGSRSGGRRIAFHEFPKRDQPYAEDMGRKGRRFQVSAYIVGPMYQMARDALCAALDAEGPGTLIHPTIPGGQYVCADYNVVERRQAGGMAEFDITFLEVGAAPNLASILDTAGQIMSKAAPVAPEAAKKLDSDLAAPKPPAKPTPTETISI